MPRSSLLLMTLGVLALLLPASGLPGCGGGSTAPAPASSGTGDLPTEPILPPPSPPLPPPPDLPRLPLFQDVTAAAGIDASHVALAEYEVTGQAWGDYDGDGWQDLYVTGGQGSNTLYRNVGDGTFVVSDLVSQVRLPDAISGGAVFADYDNDGWRDLYVLNDGANVLYHNDGGTGFSDVTATAGVGDDGRGMTGSWGDYDGDGYLDLYVANWGPLDFADESAAGLLNGRDRLYHNEGDGTFEDVTDRLGEHPTTGFGFVASFVDFDDDGDPDLYLLNDKGSPGSSEVTRPMNRNVLWRNDGDGPAGWIFTEIAVEVGADARLDAMGLAVGDYDNDLDLDFYCSDNVAMALLNQRDDHTFEDLAATAGVASSGFGWAAMFFDFDLDGWLDLFLARTYLQNVLFYNEQDGTFADASTACLPPETDATMGAAYADYDRDGWVDYVAGVYADGYRLYRNAGSLNGPDHGWLSVRLVGGGPVNRDAVGSRVYLTRSDGLVLMQEVKCGSSLGSGNDLALQFGLGVEDATEVRVVWPDGREQTFTESLPRSAEWVITY